MLVAQSSCLKESGNALISFFNISVIKIFSVQMLSMRIRKLKRFDLKFQFFFFQISLNALILSFEFSDKVETR